jgi:rhamnosyltransferase
MSFSHDSMLVLPTRNPGRLFDAWVDALAKSTSQPGIVWVIDSCSTDGTQEKARQSGFRVTTVDVVNFNHGSTRQIAVNNSDDYKFIVFMTQDAILSDAESLGNLLGPFRDAAVAAVCGRQLPHSNANDIEAHSRIYNYPDRSAIRTFDDRHRIGLKAAFLSNSFAAYRLSALREVGGFPGDVIFGEDMYVAAKLLMAGYKIAYAADACVRHSHAYSLQQDMQRYFDMGVFHAHEPWLRKEFGGAEKAGLSFVISEVKYLARNAFWRIPEGLLRTALRYLGFRLGLSEKYIPISVKRWLCMNKGYFKIH